MSGNTADDPPREPHAAPEPATAKTISSRRRLRRMSFPVNVHFIGGTTGPWAVQNIVAIAGETLPNAERLLVDDSDGARGCAASWHLQGVVSNERYVTSAEKRELALRQPKLGRPEANCAALIPIRKNAAWWALAQDERRAIFEERSHHIAASQNYLPAIARRLHHARDLGEPFDFLTWFEFAAADVAVFDELLRMLRQTEEWTYVEREVDIRLLRIR